MTPKEKLEFYKELYLKEFDTRDQLNNAISMPISIITALLAGIFYLIINFNYNNTYDCIFYVFAILLVITSGLTFAGILYLIKYFTSFKKEYEYSDLPYGKELDKYNTDLINAAVKQGHTASAGEDAFESYLVSKFLEFADTNARINDKRRKRFNTSKRMLVFAVLFISLSFIPYIKKYFDKKESVTRVEIVKVPTK